MSAQIQVQACPAHDGKLGSLSTIDPEGLRAFTHFCAKRNSPASGYNRSWLTDGPGGLHIIMQPRTLHTLELTGAIVGQTVLLAIGWGFLGAVFASDPLSVSDSLALLMFSKPTETTWIITLLATILSVATTTYGFIIFFWSIQASRWFVLLSFLSTAFKEALRHRMHKSISLIQLSAGIALASNSFLINFRHLIPTLVTMLVFGVTKLLVSRYTRCLVLQETKRSHDNTQLGCNADTDSCHLDR